MNWTRPVACIRKYKLSANFGRPGRTSDENIKWDQDSGDSRHGNERMDAQTGSSVCCSFTDDAT